MVYIALSCNLDAQSFENLFDLIVDSGGIVLARVERLVMPRSSSSNVLYITLPLDGAHFVLVRSHNVMFATAKVCVDLAGE